MGTIEDLASRLKAAGLGTLGTSSTGGSTGPCAIFLRVLPEHPGRTLALLDDRPGLTPVRTYAAPLPAVERPSVTLVVRTTAPAGGAPVPLTTGAYANARRAWAVLDTIANESTSGGRPYLRVEGPEGGPWMMGRDSAGRVLFGCPFVVSRAPSSTGG